MTAYEVRHSTEYSYEKEVSASYGQLHMLPRLLPGQRCRHSEIRISPTPELYRERVDFFGNRVAHFQLQEPHRVLKVQAHSVVEVDDRGDALPMFGERPWQSVRDALAGGAVAYDLTQYVLDSPLVRRRDEYLEYARDCFDERVGMLEAVSALCHRIHQDFEYKPGSTSVSTPLADAFEKRVGVCQDFAHLGIACLRALGLAARYVSGYLETLPPPGKPKLTGVDGSHAWLSVYLPDTGWYDIDPTNDQPANGRYITTAVGRDYSDVPPMQGVIYTDGATRKLEVKVDVTALESQGR